MRRQEGNAGGYPGRGNLAESPASALSGGQRGGGDKDLPPSAPRLTAGFLVTLCLRKSSLKCPRETVLDGGGRRGPTAARSFAPAIPTRNAKAERKREEEGESL